MSEIIKKNPNKLRTSVAAGVAVLSGLAINSCASADKGDEVPAPACAVHIDSGDTLWKIAADSNVDDIRQGISEIEAINSGMNAGNLSVGDDVAISAEMCQGLVENKESNLDVTILPSSSEQK